MKYREYALFKGRPSGRSLGDHGDAFGEHGARQHALALYEETLHVPMLIYAPSVFRESAHITGARQQLDTLPTVAALLGFKVDGGPLAGSSPLSPVPADRRIYFSSVLEDVALGMRQGHRKYVYQFGRQPMEVYDLARDPHERRSIGRGQNQRSLSASEDEMLAWYERSKLAMLSVRP